VGTQRRQQSSDPLQNEPSVTTVADAVPPHGTDVGPQMDGTGALRIATLFRPRLPKQAQVSVDVHGAEVPDRSCQTPSFSPLVLQSSTVQATPTRPVPEPRSNIVGAHGTTKRGHGFHKGASLEDVRIDYVSQKLTAMLERETVSNLTVEMLPLLNGESRSMKSAHFDERNSQPVGTDTRGTALQKLSCEDDGQDTDSHVEGTKMTTDQPLASVQTQTDELRSTVSDENLGQLDNPAVSCTRDTSVSLHRSDQGNRQGASSGISDQRFIEDDRQSAQHQQDAVDIVSRALGSVDVQDLLLSIVTDGMGTDRESASHFPHQSGADGAQHIAVGTSPSPAQITSGTSPKPPQVAAVGTSPFRVQAATGTNLRLPRMLTSVGTSPLQSTPAANHPSDQRTPTQPSSDPEDPTEISQLPLGSAPLQHTDLSADLTSILTEDIFASDGEIFLSSDGEWQSDPLGDVGDESGSWQPPSEWIVPRLQKASRCAKSETGTLSDGQLEPSPSRSVRSRRLGGDAATAARHTDSESESFSDQAAVYGAFPE